MQSYTSRGINQCKKMVHAKAQRRKDTSNNCMLINTLCSCQARKIHVSLMHYSIPFAV